MRFRLRYHFLIVIAEEKYGLDCLVAAAGRCNSYVTLQFLIALEEKDQY